MLRAGIAVEDAVLAAFLVVDDELHRQLLSAGPLGVEALLSVASQIARGLLLLHGISGSLLLLAD